MVYIKNIYFEKKYVPFVMKLRDQQTWSLILKFLTEKFMWEKGQFSWIISRVIRRIPSRYLLTYQLSELDLDGDDADFLTHWNLLESKQAQILKINLVEHVVPLISNVT